jgi:hypothetical protein
MFLRFLRIGGFFFKCVHICVVRSNLASFAVVGFLCSGPFFFILCKLMLRNTYTTDVICCFKKKRLDY